MSRNNENHENNDFKKTNSPFLTTASHSRWQLALSYREHDDPLSRLVLRSLPAGNNEVETTVGVGPGGDKDEPPKVPTGGE